MCFPRTPPVPLIVTASSFDPAAVRPSREARMIAATVALDYLTALALICVALGFLGWARRRCADLRGTRLPPMRLL